MPDINQVVSDGSGFVALGLKPGGEIFYFHNQIKLVAMIRKGIRRSATLSSRLFCGDKDLGWKLYDLYMFYKIE